MTVSARLTAVLNSQLGVFGFKKRAGRVFTLEIAEDTLGWLGINTASKGYAAGTMGMNVVIGLRSQSVEKLVADLGCTPFHPYLPPTVRTSLGRLTPEGRYREWIYDGVNDTNGVELRPLMDFIDSHAVTFMKANARMIDIRTLLDRGWSSDVGFPYRLVVADVLIGDIENALVTTHRALQALGARTDQAAEEARAFASRVRSRFS